MSPFLKIICFAVLAISMHAHANAETFFFVGSNFPVLSYETDEGDLEGIGVDIARMIGNRLGHTINLRLYPWKRAQYMVKTGMADVLMAPYKSTERETWLDFSETPFFTDKSVLVVKPGSTLSWDGDFSSLKGLKIGMVSGWSLGAPFDDAKKNLSIDYAPTLEVCFLKLFEDRIEVVPTPLREAVAAFERLGLSMDHRPEVINPPLTINYNYYGFTKQKDLSTFKKNFDRELKTMQETGKISLLLKEKYGIENSNPIANEF